MSNEKVRKMMIEEEQQSPSVNEIVRYTANVQKVARQTIDSQLLAQCKTVVDSPNS